MYTREQLKSLTDEQMISIANILDPRDNWEVSRRFENEEQIYEVLSDAGNGQYDAIVQILWGEQYDTVSGDMDVSFLIRHFNSAFEETLSSSEEMEKIIKVINNA
jgi:hypothetical protein